MSDKRDIKKNIQRIQRVATWQLLVLLIVAGFLTATFLRLNNIGMVQRRDAVLAADVVGDEAVIANRLLDLQQYTLAHMNSSTGPFYLEQQYRRSAEKVVEEAKSKGNPNGNINIKAEAVCKPRYAVWSPAYVQCFTDELAKYPPSPDPAQNIDLPSTSLYRYDYQSPRWSPDFAGLMVLVCLGITTVIVLRLASLGILHLMLKHHYKTI